MLRLARAIAAGLREGACRASAAACLRYRSRHSRRGVSCERRGWLALSQSAFKEGVSCKPPRLACVIAVGLQEGVCRASAAACLRYRSRPSRGSVSCECCGLLALSQSAFKKGCVVRVLQLACAIAVGIQEGVCRASAAACSRYRSGPSKKRRRRKRISTPRLMVIV